VANDSPNAGDGSPLLNTLAFTGSKAMDSSALALAVFSRALFTPTSQTL